MKIDVKLPAEGLSLTKLFQDIEESLIAQALDQTHNVKAHAAKLLGITRTSLLKKMTKLGYSLNPPMSKKVKAIEK